MRGPTSGSSWYTLLRYLVHCLVELGKIQTFLCSRIQLYSPPLQFSDKFLCSLWRAVSFPYLHCAWHIMVFVAAYTACVMFAYFDALDEVI